MPSSQTPPSFHVMIKPRGSICNLDCAYCYYLAKENLYPDGTFRMPDNVLESYTRQYMAAQRVPEVTFGWQGGEPLLMGLEFFERALAYQEQYRPAGMTVHNAMQTNGVLLDDDWCAFFAEHNFLVGISIDGPGELHDGYRVDKGGAPTLERVMRGVERLKAHNVDFNVLTCVQANNGDHPLEVYRFLRDEVGAIFMQFIPIIERQGDGVTDRSVGAAQYGAFLSGVFDEWVRRDVGRVFVQIFDVALAAWSGQRPGLCVFEETCGTALVMEHNGDLYSCDHFVEPEYFLGNIMEKQIVELVSDQAQVDFGNAKRDAMPDMCRQCPVLFVCHGGCPKNRIISTPDGQPGLNYLCEGYKAFFTHIDGPMRYMANELMHRRPPANIMIALAREEAALQERFKDVGRNDPCPCGSGKKFKHCHGRR